MIVIRGCDVSRVSERKRPKGGKLSHPLVYLSTYERNEAKVAMTQKSLKAPLVKIHSKKQKFTRYGEQILLHVGVRIYGPEPEGTKTERGLAESVPEGFYYLTFYPYTAIDVIFWAQVFSIVRIKLDKKVTQNHSSDVDG